ncbi:MAG: hypothetical protein NT062_11510 [Proteobacteria bacterium]|nr:hypothetical protein [Pseudomonadota bacterium]
MSKLWDTWKTGFATWEATTAQYLEKVMSTPAVLQPAATMMTAVMKTKAKADRAMTSWWALWGLSTRSDQERSLHKLNQLESKILDLQEVISQLSQPSRPSGPSTRK